jgi:hypothetical protein
MRNRYSAVSYMLDKKSGPWRYAPYLLLIGMFPALTANALETVRECSTQCGAWAVSAAEIIRQAL